MDITEPEFNISLQEALTYYLTYLSHSQKLREARLPHQGKGVETVADLVTQVNYESRIAASETCLQYTGRIARRVRRWYCHADEPDGDLEEPDDGDSVEVDMETFSWFLEAVPEDPFLDPFSGKWIGPTNAGPCPKNDEAVNDRVQDVTERKVQQRPPIQRQEPYRKIAHEYLDRKSKARRSRPSLGLHPNFPISVVLTAEVGHRSPSERSSDTSIEIILTPTSSVADDETSTAIHNSEMKVKYDETLELDDRDRKYAEQLAAEERHRRRQTRRAFAEAKRLSENLAREEQTRLEEQRRYAKNLEREEKVYAEQVRLNREAAEKAQARLETEARKRSEDRRQKEREDTTAREVEANKKSKDRRRRERQVAITARQIEGTKKSEDRRRREREEERKRLHLEHENISEKEKDKKVRFGRESSLSTKSKRQALSLFDEKRWREAYDIQEDHRRKKEVETKSREAKPKKVDCVSCMEPGIKKEMAVLPCNHAYCGECITGAFKSAYKSHTPFKCCGKSVSTTNLTSHLSSSFIERYNNFLLELSTKNPLYCSSASCSKFIPPSSIHGPIATCLTCKNRTCVSCRKKEHSGVCKEDKEGKKVQELAKKKGWKQCPKCSQILERTEGCLHMTCRCRAEWCYACLRDWDKCNSTCGRDGGPLEHAGTDNLRIGNPPEDLFAIGGVRGNEDMLRRIVEHNLQRAQRNIVERQEAQGTGILGAIARGFMYAMLED